MFIFFHTIIPVFAFAAPFRENNLLIRNFIFSQLCFKVAVRCCTVGDDVVVSVYSQVCSPMPFYIHIELAHSPESIVRALQCELLTNGG